MDNEAITAISNLAQNGVDMALNQCWADGHDPIAAMEAMIFTSEQTILCASEALEHLKKEQSKEQTTE